MNESTPITNAIEHIVPPNISPLAKKLRKKGPTPGPVHDDPRDELRRLVREHTHVTRLAVSFENSANDRTNKTTGEKIPCVLPSHIRVDILNSAKALRTHAASLKPKMTVELRKIPIFIHFLSKVWGVCGEDGGTVAAYLCASVKIDRCVKPSQLVRYCGNACDPRTGKREIRIRNAGPKYAPNGSLTGATGTYNDVLKSVIWQGMCSLRKNAARKSANRPNGTTTKYLDCWLNAVHWRKTNGKEKGAEAAGRRKATDLFLEDLYMVWRTLERLPVWPDLYSARRGYRHGGAPCLNEGIIMTMDQALAAVGDTGPRPASAPVPEAESSDEPEEMFD
jgi:hypothetical protein